MADYRAFLLNADGRICKAVELQACDEDDARREVEQVHRPEHGFELWSGRSLIAKVNRDEA